MALSEYIQEAKAHCLNNLLGCATEPNDLFDERELGVCYKGLAHYLDNQYQGSKVHKQHAIRGWGILEFQSSWHVLGQYFPDEEIKELSSEQRQEQFIQKLTENQDSFPTLYFQREITQKKLEEKEIL